MMKMFTVKDMKSGLHNRPFFEQSTPAALRSWEITANEGDSMIRKFPADFRLLEIGQFDELSGAIELYGIPTDLGSALDVQKGTQPTPIEEHIKSNARNR